MALSAKFIRSQLSIFKPFVTGCSLEVARKGQDKLGEVLAAVNRNDVEITSHRFDNFDSVWVTPSDELIQGVILYVHGGGYTCGDIDYAKGFGSVLASECGMKVFCVAYRLAPENKFPAAIDDALEAYRYLLRSGYTGKQIVLCGESAGGGLIYALCLMLKALGFPLPAGIIAISPWTDLTQSGNSYETNKSIDPSMTRDRLDYYADCYTADKRNPYVSPLFGDVTGLPPSLIFVGGDEVMLDDARRMHTKLLENGCKSRLIITPEMWHAYVLYCMKENESDFVSINGFLKSVLDVKRKLRWMRLDNAAKMYPATVKRDWSNVFRLSATLTEKVDRSVLASALEVTVRRFPSIAVRLRRATFWYYLEEIPKEPDILDESSYPISHMTISDIKKCAFRVICYGNRIAVEFFHALTDGNGGLTFLKTLVAEYVTQKYGISIPNTDGILDRLQEPKDEELEDSFIKNSGAVSMPRKEAASYRILGTRELDGFLHLTTFKLDVGKVHELSKFYGVSITSFLCAVMIKAILEIQNDHVPYLKRQKEVKVIIPVNLRKFFDSKTIRNFALFVTPGIDPRMGEYDFAEICKAVHYQMGMEVTKKRMQARITTNVRTENSLLLRSMPLFIKNLAIKAVFDAIGETTSCLSLSNLGDVKLPDELAKFVTRLDFILGVQASAPYNCGVLSYNNKMYISLIRNIRESELELKFWETLKQVGLKATVESNERG